VRSRSSMLSNHSEQPSRLRTRPPSQCNVQSSPRNAQPHRRNMRRNQRNTPPSRHNRRNVPHHRRNMRLSRRNVPRNQHSTQPSPHNTQLNRLSVRPSQRNAPRNQRSTQLSLRSERPNLLNAPHSQHSRSAPSNRHKLGSKSGDGYKRAAGRAMTTSSRIAINTGPPTIAPGPSAEATAAAIFPSSLSASILASTIFSESACCRSCTWVIPASNTTATHS